MTQEIATANGPEDVSGGLLGVIARAARDPSVDIDRMERLYAMLQTEQARQAKLEFVAAKIAMRPELPVITERGKIIIRDKNNRERIIQETSFALFEDLNEILNPIVTSHGFDLSFRSGDATDGKVRVYTILTHRAGHAEETYFDLPPDASGSKNAVQAIGSSTSYAKRYGMLEILNITTKGADDDGATATYKAPSGEPMPRAKLNGIYTSKTALKAAIDDLRAKAIGAQSVKALDDIMKEGKEAVAQAQRDWPALIDGFPNVPEDVGLRGEVQAQRIRLTEGGALDLAIDRMKDCGDRLALEGWMEANAAYLETLDGADSRRFQAAYDQFEAGLAAVDAMSAG